MAGPGPLAGPFFIYLNTLGLNLATKFSMYSTVSATNIMGAQKNKKFYFPMKVNMT
eukprot:SAG31_NODE_19395_length_603_cov_1.392857_1_plen_55_part_01